MYIYYENGYPQKMPMRKLYRFFETQFDKEQKQMGTTFSTWLSEMEKMQILIRM